MIKWLFLACVSISLLAGCVTRSSGPVCTPTSNSPVAPSTNNYAGTTNSQVKITGFQDYDHVLIERIRKQWRDLISNENFDIPRTGKVVVHFVLHSDGTVSDMRTTENNVGDVLGYTCMDAIQKSAPFPNWSLAMIKNLGNSRDIVFTFYYK
jgi:hypothetical protein